MSKDIGAPVLSWAQRFTSIRAPAKADGYVRGGAYLVLLVLLICPILAVDIPAMVDYPNHLARMYILIRDGTTAASPFYEVTWALYPNVAMDVAVPWLAHLMGVEAATRTVYLASQVLVIGGAITLERVVKGRSEISPFAVGMFLYSLPFTWGFVNFEFGFGVALWAIVGWWAMKGRGWASRVAIHCIFVAVLFAAHFFALGIYGATVGLHELWRVSSRRARATEAVITFASLSAPVLVLLAAMALQGGSVVGTANEWCAACKLLEVFHSMSGYSVWLSAIGVFFILSASAVLILRGSMRLVEGGGWIVAGFALLFVTIPFRLFDTTFADVRVITAAGFILPRFRAPLDSERGMETGPCVSGRGLRSREPGIGMVCLDVIYT